MSALWHFFYSDLLSSISCDQGFLNKSESTQTSCYLLLPLKLGLESFPVHIPLLSLLLFFPTKLGILIVHLQMACGENGNPGLVNGNRGKTGVVSPNFDQMQGIPISIIQNPKSSIGCMIK